MASTAEVDLVIDTSDTLPELERDLTRIINAAEDGAPAIDVEAHIEPRVLTNEFLQEVRTAQRAAAANALGVDVALGADIASLERELASVVEVLEESAPEVDIEVDVDRDGEGARGARNLTRAFGSLSGILPQVSGRMLAFGSAGIAAVPLTAALSSAIASILPASALAVSGLTSLALVGGATALAFNGVGEAVKNAFDPDVTPEDLAKSMEALAPNARAFVLELRSMKDEFKELQQDVQQTFFQGLDAALDRLGKTVLPVVSSALRTTALQLNAMALGAAGAASQLAENGTLGQALAGANRGLSNLTNLPAQFVTGLGQIGAAAAPAFDRVTQAVASAATSISERLGEAFESGALESAINGAVDAIAQLGRIAGNVFEGLGNIFDNLNAGGEGLFSVLEKVTQAFADVTATQGFQQALTAVASTLGILVDTALPLLSQALQALGPVFVALAGPLQIIIQALGPALSKIIAALAPVLVSVANAFGQLAIVLAPILTLAGELIAAVLPGLIPLFDAVGQTLNTLVPFVEALVSALSTALVPLFTQIATEVLPQLLPPLVQLSTAIIPVLTEVIIGLAPVLAQIATVFGEVLVAVTPLIVELVNLTLAIGERLAPILGPLLDLMIKLTVAGFQFLADIITGVVIPVINIIVDLLRGDFSAAWEKTKDLVKNVATKIGDFISEMEDRLLQILGDLGNQAMARVRQLTEDMVRGFIDLSIRVTGVVRELPGKILNALGNLGNLLMSAGADIVRGLINGIQSQLGRLRDAASEIAGAVSGSVKDLLGISSPSKVMMEVGNDTMDGFLLGIADRIPDLRAQLQGVASLAPSFALPGGQTLQLPQLSQQGPVVQVFIGNEQLNSHFDTRIAQSSQARDLLISRGVRR